MMAFGIAREAVVDKNTWAEKSGCDSFRFVYNYENFSTTAGDLGTSLVAKLF